MQENLNETKYAYCYNNCAQKLLEILEKDFPYQKVLLVAKNFDAQKKVLYKGKCNIIEGSLTGDLSSFSCIVAVDVENYLLLKEVSKKFNIPYFVVLSSPISAINLKSEFLHNGKNISYNVPSGIFVDIFKTSATEFSFLSLLEIISSTFIVSESYLNSVMFNIKQNNDYISNLKNILKRAGELLKDTLMPAEMMLFKTAELYLEYLVLMQKIGQTIADQILCIYKFNKNLSLKEEIFSSFAINLEILCLYFSFIQNFNPKLKGTINYNFHSKFLKEVGVLPKFKTEEIDALKQNFLLDELKEGCLEMLKTYLQFSLKQKEKLVEIDAENSFKLSSFLKKINLVNSICLSVNFFNKNTFLKVLYYNGLLNFDF